MNRFHKILVCISHLDGDAKRIHYTSRLTRLAKSKEIHLLHVVDPESAGGLGLPAGGGLTLQTLHQIADENLEEGGDREVLCEVREGTPLMEILKYTQEKDIDLLVVGGGGPEPPHEADLAPRITRKSTCSVLVLPSDVPDSSTKILVPVRDSECSANALETACRVAQATGGEVVALNVFRVHSDPAGGASAEEQTERCRELAEEENRNLLDRIFAEGIEVRTECLPNLYDHTIDILLEAIGREEADLIVIGARGRTDAAGVLLGATTEKLIRQARTPLLAVKKKGEVFGIFDALMTIAGQR